jgi:hypothetical protein
MAKPWPETKCQETRPAEPVEQRVLRCSFRSATAWPTRPGEYEVIGRPYTTNAGKDVHVGVKRVDNAEVTMIRSWSAHERLAVNVGRRAGDGEVSSADVESAHGEGMMGMLITIHASVFLLLLGIFTLVALMLPVDRGSMKVYAYLPPSFAIYLVLFHLIKARSKPRRRVRK